MTSRLAIGFVAAAALSACMPPAASAPRPVKPEDGPRGSVHVDYSGGVFTRQIQTRFRVDHSAYVLVGHLGGDGVLRVLYPETLRSSGWVSGGKTILLKSQAAPFDLSPHLYSFAAAPWRSTSAELDSYDGMGHGYVFMITSRYPIDYGALVEGNGFESLEIEDYDQTRDPRLAVRSFADELVTGPYSLKFANNNGSAYARTGCGMRWGLMGYANTDLYGFSPWLDFGQSYFGYPGLSLLNGIAFARMYGMQSCRGSYYASMYRPIRIYSTTVTVPVPGTPQTPITPRLQRPTRRTLEDRERTPVFTTGRSSLSRPGTSANRALFDRPGTSRRPTSSRDVWPTRGREGTIERSSGPAPMGGYSRPEHAARPMDTPRLHTPAPPPPPTTSASAPTSGETRSERPRPQP